MSYEHECEANSRLVAAAFYVLLLLFDHSFVCRTYWNSVVGNNSKYSLVVFGSRKLSATIVGVPSTSTKTWFASNLPCGHGDRGCGNTIRGDIAETRDLPQVCPRQHTSCHARHAAGIAPIPSAT